jgi:secreted trypsin-like serine protease
MAKIMKRAKQGWGKTFLDEAMFSDQKLFFSTHRKGFLAVGLLIALSCAGLWAGNLQAQDGGEATPVPDKRGRPYHPADVVVPAQNVPEIVGGEEAAPGAWPWAAAIVIACEANAHNGEYCTGSLIQAQWVLTAAHCTFDDKGAPYPPGVFDVVLGRHQLSTTSGERIHVVQIIRHPQYSPNSLDWDVALFKLATPSGAVTIALIDPNKPDSAAPDTLATVIGWGVTQAHAEEASDVLRQVSLPLVSYRSCTYAYGIFANVITPRMLCGGFAQGDKSACYGDSGGPVMTFDTQRNRWIQVGVVSWGSNSCSGPNQYNVYSRLSEFATWIIQQIPAVATPTSTATPTATPTLISTVPATAPTSTPVPSGLTAYLPLVARQEATIIKQLQNGNFEAGVNAGWAEHSLYAVALVVNKSALSLPSRTGNYVAQLGNLDNEVAVVEQVVTVPAGSAILHYSYWIQSEDDCSFDFGGVVVNDVVVAKLDLCTANKTTGWQQRSVNLTAYAGQIINLQFRAETDGDKLSILYIDDVSFAATGIESSTD